MSRGSIPKARADSAILAAVAEVSSMAAAAVAPPRRDAERDGRMVGLALHGGAPDHDDVRARNRRTRLLLRPSRRERERRYDREGADQEACHDL